MQTNTQTISKRSTRDTIAVVSSPLLVSVVCHCGEPAIIGLHFTNYNHGRWIPNCEQCYHTHLENAQEVNDHEIRLFGGAYGLVTWEERDIAGAEQDPADGSLYWSNAEITHADE